MTPVRRVWKTELLGNLGKSSLDQGLQAGSRAQRLDAWITVATGVPVCQTPWRGPAALLQAPVGVVVVGCRSMSVLVIVDNFASSGIETAL